jgi:hypothetical protein
MPHPFISLLKSRGVGWEDPISHDLHTDQSFARNDFECIQSWVTANHVDTGDATLALLEGSHLYHEDFGAHFGITDRENWFNIKGNEEYMQFYLERGCVKRYLRCPRGSLVLLDSRLISLWCPCDGVEKDSIHSLRCVFVLSTEKHGDRSAAGKEAESIGRNANNKTLAMQSDFVSEGFRYYDKVVKEISRLEKPVYNESGLRLAGYYEKE